MDDRSQDFDLTKDQKSRLLNLGLRSRPCELGTDERERKTDMLYDVLAQPLPINSSVADSLPAVVRGLSSRLQSLAGQPIGNLLQNPGTDMAIILRIKEYAKKSGTSTDSQEKSDVFLAVYYAAIASALVFHNQKITQHSYSDLKHFFCSFAQNDWILDELISLFNHARRCCLEKTSKEDLCSH